MTTITELQAEIKAWADGVFPERTAHGALCKLMLEELPELSLNPHSAAEFADAVILLLDIATLNGIDIEQAVRDKMALNRKRTWAIDHDTGLMHHINAEQDGHRVEARHLARRAMIKESSDADSDTQTG